MIPSNHKLIPGILLALVIAGSARASSRIPIESSDTVQVSVFELIVNPSDFDGNIVLVRGYLTKFSGRLILYPGKEFALIGGMADGVLIDKPHPDEIKERCIGSYVEIEGSVGLIPTLKLRGITEAKYIRKFRISTDRRASSLGC